MKQLARREIEQPSFFEGFLRRLREFAGGESATGDVRETIEELIGEAEEEAGASLSAEERALVRNALGFGELRVADVMVPRGDIRGVDVGSDLPHLVAVLHEAGLSRVVVYRATLDDVLGVVHIKDLLPFWNDPASFSLETVVRPVLVVPPSMRAIDLMREMRQARNHVAVVVDEFGGIDGLLTINDLVEELTGELQDEHDRASEPELVENGDGTLTAEGRADLEEVEKRLAVPLLGEDERDEADTLGGLIFGLVDRVPARGETVEHPSGVVFEVLDADPRRIKRVRIHRPPAAEGERATRETDA